MKRWMLTLALAMLPTVAHAQLTPMPNPLITWFGLAGLVLDDGGLCVFQAGTSTLAATYTTAAGSVANANPVRFNASGRATSGGVFLTPGSSYKFVLKDFTGVSVPTCIPDSGVTIWSVDNVEAVPGSSAAVDIIGTAGETITAGQVVYLSDGSGAKNAGQWYLADADLTYAGALPIIGMAPNDVTSGSSGSFRIQGAIDGLTSLNAGSDYFVSSTPGAVTVTAPAFARLVGRAESATVMIVAPNPRSTPISPREPCGRLTLTTGVPVTTSDVTAATTVYYAPYGGCNSISTYNGSVWVQQTFAEISIAVPATTSQMYDVFAYDNAGTLTLELTAWTNDTTRATALTTQNAVYVKTGAVTRLYLGSVRTTAVSGQTEDSVTKRYLWNYYHRVLRVMRVVEATASWTYSAATFQQANASAANQLDYVMGVQEDAVRADVRSIASNNNGNVQWVVGIGLGSTTVDSATTSHGTQQQTANSTSPVSATYVGFPGIGRRTLVWIERGDGSVTTTWRSAVLYGLSGIIGEVWG